MQTKQLRKIAKKAVRQALGLVDRNGDRRDMLVLLDLLMTSCIDHRGMLIDDIGDRGSRSLDNDEGTTSA